MKRGTGVYRVMYRCCPGKLRQIGWSVLPAPLPIFRPHLSLIGHVEVFADIDAPHSLPQNAPQSND